MSQRKAQLQLVEHLAQLADIKHGSEILDIGCGMGGSSLFLARNYNANRHGITISPVQVEMATAAAARERIDVKFLLMERRGYGLQEAIRRSLVCGIHLPLFSALKISLLRQQTSEAPAAHSPIIDWFQKENLTSAETKKFIQPIEKGMLCELQIMDDYEQYSFERPADHAPRSS